MKSLLPRFSPLAGNCVASLFLLVSPAMGAPSNAAPQPSEQMLSVEKALTGTWSIAETFAASDTNADSINTPHGGTGHGIEVWRSGPGGFTFMEEERNHTPAGEVYIVGYMWWDATKKQFGGMECNSQWPEGCDPKSSLSLVSLSWNGKELVVDFKDEKDPGKLAWHEVFSHITSTSFVQTGDIGQPDGTLKRWVTIKATRVK